MPLTQTIVAIASPTDQAIRGVVRLSGTHCRRILSEMGIEFLEIPPNTGFSAQRPHRWDSQLDLGDPLGMVCVAVLFWPTDRSYTGQPSAELHTYGSLPILRAIVDCCTRHGGRAARPGEFTMRAFLAGRLDLTQAEAVLGVIEARGKASLDHALRQLAGNLSGPLAGIRCELLDLLADVEAGLDFVDEDIEFIADDVLVLRLQQIQAQIASAARQIQSRGGGSATVSIVLRGDPNAGKSRLMNTLIGDDAAIVADLAGTTRDVVSATTVIEGHAVTLMDTAGIETANDPISAESQRKGNEVAQHACIRIWCIDADRDDFLEAAEMTSAAVASLTESHAGGVDLLVATKCDLRGRLKTLDVTGRSSGVASWIPCSAITGEGIDDLRQAMARAIDQNDAEATESIIGTAARCAQSFQESDQAVAAAIDLTRRQTGHEFISAELRTAAQCIGEITGEVYNDDILDRVFSRFCIGK